VTPDEAASGRAVNLIAARPLAARRPGDVATAGSPPTPPEATPAAAAAPSTPFLPPPPTTTRPSATLANGATKQRPADLDLAVVLPDYTKMVADKTQCRAKYGRRDYFPMGQRRKPPMLYTFPGRYAATKTLPFYCVTWIEPFAWTIH